MATTAVQAGQAPGQSEVYRYKLPFVIAASAAGTVIEWYDFYLYGVLPRSSRPSSSRPATTSRRSSRRWPRSAPGSRFGRSVLPFFGRIGDIIGRKFTFLLTITFMGGATALVGVLPTYAQIGILAPIILVTLRLVQGLALGGEYGGAAIYVAEHAPDHQRGKYTSWIQTTATVGLLLALAVILFFRLTLGRRRLQGIRLADPVHPVGLPRRARAVRSGSGSRKRRCSHGSRPKADRPPRRGARASATRRTGV